MQSHQLYLRGLLAGMVMTFVAVAADAPNSLPAPGRSIETATPDAPAAATPTPSNQIWECITNGIRTFSNNPCGAKSAVRQLNPVNVMEPAPAYRVNSAYTPRVSASVSQYAYQTQENSGEVPADSVYNGNPTYIVVPRAHRLRAGNARYHPRPHHP